MSKMPLPLTLCRLARKTIEAYINGEKFEPDKATKEKYKEKKACFVTLSINGRLRGCVGCLEAKKELWKNVQENAIHAAFHDPRFMPLTKDELKEIKIEVSVLNVAKKLKFENEKDLLDKIDTNMGIILKRNFNSATFLPQVWEEIPDKIDFLECLSRKAGLDKNAWKQPSTELWYYTVEVEEE